MNTLTRPESQALFFANEFQSNFDGFFPGCLIFECDLHTNTGAEQFPELYNISELLGFLGGNYLQGRVVFNPSAASILMAKLAYPSAYQLTDNDSYIRLNNLYSAFKIHMVSIDHFSEASATNRGFLTHLRYAVKSLNTSKQQEVTDLEAASSSLLENLDLYHEKSKNVLRMALSNLSC